MGATLESNGRVDVPRRCDSQNMKGGSVRNVVVAICLFLMMANCGGDLTLAEYAEESERLIVTMNRVIDDLDVERESNIPTVESIQAYFNAKIAARHELLDGFQTLGPPEDGVEMHAVALELLTKLTAAEEAFARRVAAVESVDELSLLEDTPEFLAMEAIDDESVALCQAAQADFDATADRQIFADYPWISPELQEIVVVFLGCTEDERVGGT